MLDVNLMSKGDEKMKQLFQLFITFAKIGGMTFGGGYAMLPFLQREIVEKNKWATEEEIMEIIKEFIPEGTEFTIEKVENESGETKVIVKFTDKKTAENFVEGIRNSSDAKRTVIKVGFSYDDIGSFSSSLTLNALVYFLSYLISLCSAIFF